MMGPWEEFTQRAINDVRFGKGSSKEFWGPKLRLMEYPSHGNIRSWTVFPLPNNDSRACDELLDVTVREWNSALDWPEPDDIEETAGSELGTAEFNSEFRRRLPPYPTISESVLKVPAALVLELLSQLANLVFPFAPGFQFDGKGNVYEIEFGSMEFATMIRWQGELPRAWKSLIEGFGPFLDYLISR